MKIVIEDADCNDFNELANLARKGKIHTFFMTDEDEERLQGEWIFHKDNNESCKYGCNQCGNLTNIPSNFCPNCGVRMKKGRLSVMCKDCKECLNSRVIISENGYKAICTLSAKESNDCLLNDKCKFKGNQLYLMIRGDAE